MAKKKVTREEEEVDKSRGYGKTYTVRAFSIQNEANNLLNSNFATLEKHARRKGLPRPTLTKLLSIMITRSGKIKATEYFK